MAIVEPSLGFAFVIAGLVGLGNPILGFKLFFDLTALG
jgi:hypothetical protein